MIKVVASSIVNLDSNVRTGGGTDVTEVLQEVLDRAPEAGGVHLVMDGAALIHGLKVHSNTTIECMGSDCGFFMKDYANRPMLSNYDQSFAERITHDIRLIGGTYNHNCTRQVHHLDLEEFPYPESLKKNYYAGHGIFLMEFYGVENFYLDGVIFKNQRTYAFSMGNFRNVVLENTAVEMADHVHPSNQDGYHFFGPGQFLTMRNLRGCTGDDFINLSQDEMDGESSITDVLIDGVVFDEVCQGIRMLSRENGVLDRVTVRNVSGTYRTFAFSIQPFYRGEHFGKFGDIFLENIDVRQLEAHYHYTPMTFMQLGGDMECITLKNVRFRNPVRNSAFLELGRCFFYRPEELTEEEAERCHIEDMDTYGRNRDWMPEGKRPMIRNFIMDHVIFETDDQADKMNFIEARYQIGNCILSNVKVFRPDASKASGNLLKLANDAHVTNLFLENVYGEKLESIVTGTGEHVVDMLRAVDVTLKDGGKALDIEQVNVEKQVLTMVNEL